MLADSLTVYITQRQPRTMIKWMSIVCKIGTFPLGGGWRIPDICRESSWLTSCGTSIPGKRTQQPSPFLLVFKGSPTRKEGESEWRQ